MHIATFLPESSQHSTLKKLFVSLGRFAWRPCLCFWARVLSLAALPSANPLFQETCDPGYSSNTAVNGHVGQLSDYLGFYILV